MSFSSSSPEQLSLDASPSKSTTKVQDSNFQIFLGGSCNPTTWRQNVAVPYLEANGISYFNPQVDDWTPEVVNSERWAKQNAKILLFVIDKQTRSTVSLVESAFMAGENKNLVLVIYPFEYNIISLTDTSAQTSEFIETRSTLMRTTNLKLDGEADAASSFSRSSSSTISSTLVTSCSVQESSTSTTASRALSTTRAQQSISSQVKTSECSKSLRQPELELGQKSSIQATHEKARITSGKMKINNEIISLDEFRELRHARSMLQNLLSVRQIPMFSDILHALNYVSYSLKREMDSNLESSKSPPNSIVNNDDLGDKTKHKHQQKLDPILKFDQKTLHDVHSRINMMKDVYISFDSNDHTSIESNVISILEENGLSYNYMPVNSIIKPSDSDFESEMCVPEISIDPSQPGGSSHEMSRYPNAYNVDELTRSAIEQELCAIKSSRVLLFVITNKCRGLSVMVLASHLMALLRNNVVLCVQYLEEPCLISGENLTKTAIADYNRGRVYLSDYATKSQVPVFSTVREAIECCTLKCQHANKS